jgi:hypothetical protein
VIVVPMLEESLNRRRVCQSPVGMGLWLVASGVAGGDGLAPGGLGLIEPAGPAAFWRVSPSADRTWLGGEVLTHSNAEL